MSNFPSRLKQLRLEKGLLQKELAAEINIPRSTIAAWESGNRTPELGSVELLSQYFHVSTDYLLGKSNFRDPLPPGAWPANLKTFVPIVGVIRAGMPILAEENIEGYEVVDPEFVKNGEYFFLRVKGNSMAPKIQDGYKVLVRKQSDVDNEEVAVVIINNEDATLKRVYKENGRLILRPDNPDYPPIIINEGDTRIIGKVVYFIGKP